jgi:hypothetical protein
VIRFTRRSFEAFPNMWNWRIAKVDVTPYATVPWHFGTLSVKRPFKFK